MTNDLLKAIADIDSAIKSNKQFILPSLAKRAYEAALDLPHDSTLQVLANVLDKMASKGQVTISQGDFMKVYSKVASSTSMAGEVFSDVIGQTKAERDSGESKTANLSMPLTTDDLYGYAKLDKKVAHVFSDAWDERGNPKLPSSNNVYNPDVAKEAVYVTRLELTRLGFAPVSMEVLGGSDKFIVCQAKYETPKGHALVVVPVELLNGNALIPNMLVTSHGFADLTRYAISQHITDHGGKNIIVNASVVIDSLETVKNLGSLSEFELKILAAKEQLDKERGINKEASNNGMMQFASGSILGIQMEPEQAQVPYIMDQGKVDTFAKKLASVDGSAEFILGKDVVESGRQLIRSRMSSYGYNVQIKVASCDEDMIAYAVRVDTAKGPVGCEVIAEVNNGKLQIPSIVAVADTVYEFNKAGIDKMASGTMSDTKMLAVVSPMYDLNPLEVFSRMVVAADAGDIAVAEEALNVLAASDEPYLYEKGVKEYMRCLAVSAGTMDKVAAQKQGCGCSKVMKVSSHIGPVCGHLNLPLDKVYQNKYGECCPKYRENMAETYEEAQFLTYKAFA